MIQVHFDEFCALLRDRHAENAFAFVEAAGAGRSREAVEKIIAHPLFDEGRALAESDAVLVSLMGGKELTMAEVDRVMEQIKRQCGHAQIIMGAAVDAELNGRLSVTVIAAKHNAAAESSVGGGATAVPGNQNGAMLLRDAPSRIGPGSVHGSEPTFNLGNASRGWPKARAAPGKRIQKCARNNCHWRSFPRDVLTRANRRFTRARTSTSRRSFDAAWH